MDNKSLTHNLFNVSEPLEANQKIILSSRAKRSDLNFEIKTIDCFVAPLLAMTFSSLFGYPRGEGL